MRLEAIAIYPVKGLRAVALAEAAVEPWGLRGDRRWMVVDPGGRFLTQRDIPAMARIAAAPDRQGLVLSAPGMAGAPLLVPTPEAGAIVVSVWGDPVEARPAGETADEWLSAALGRACRLVHMAHPAAARPVDPRHAQPGDRVSFADAFPLLAVTQASLADLNARLPASVPIARFRANLIVCGSPAWAEDGWRALRVGAVTFRAPKMCERCIVVTTDQTSGERARDGEPLRTLATFRRGPDGRVRFGQNLIPDGPGRIAVGDVVEPI